MFTRLARQRDLQSLVTALGTRGAGFGELKFNASIAEDGLSGTGRRERTGVFRSVTCRVIGATESLHVKLISGSFFCRNGICTFSSAAVSLYLGIF